MISLPRDFVLLQVVPELNAGGVERTALDVSRAVVSAGGTSLIASAGGRLEDELAAHGGELIRLPIQSKNPLTIAANLFRLRDLIRKPGAAIPAPSSAASIAPPPAPIAAPVEVPIAAPNPDATPAEPPAEPRPRPARFHHPDSPKKEDYL